MYVRMSTAIKLISLFVFLFFFSTFPQALKCKSFKAKFYWSIYFCRSLSVILKLSLSLTRNH